MFHNHIQISISTAARLRPAIVPYPINSKQHIALSRNRIGQTRTFFMVPASYISLAIVSDMMLTF